MVPIKEIRSDLPPWAARLTTALGALWLGLFPLWQDGSYTRITRAKWIAMLLLTGLTAAAALGTVIALCCRGRRRALRFHPAQLMVMGYLLWLGLSARQGSMAHQLNENSLPAVIWGAMRYEGLLTQGCYAAAFLFMSLLPVRIRTVMGWASGAMLAFSGVVALQYAGLNPFRLFPEGVSVYTTPAFQGTIGNIDMVSAWLCLMIPALLGGYIFSCGGGLCLAAGLTGVMLQWCIEVQSGMLTMAAVMAAIVLLMLLWPKTRSRGLTVLGGMLALLSLRLMISLPWYDGTETLTLAFRWWKLLPLAFGALCMVAAALTRKKSGRAVPGRWVLAGAVACAALAVVAVYCLPMPQNTGLWELQEILRGRASDAFGSERLGVWRLTLEMSRGNLLWGSGPDTFLYALREHMLATDQTLTQTFDNPHNMLLAILSGSGLPALMLFLAAMGAAVLPALRRQGWQTALAMGLIAYLLQGLFTFSTCLTSPMFWVMAGMLVSGGIDEKERIDKP